MKVQPVVLLLCALAGVLLGGLVIGKVAFGCCLIFDALAVGGWGLLHYDFAAPAQPAAHRLNVSGLTLEEIFDRSQKAA